MVKAEATTNVNSTHHMPIWFSNHDPAPHPTAFEPFCKLANYNKSMGALGYVPHALKESLTYFGIKNKTTLIRGSHCA
jgi:hypothetical protein